MNANGWRVLPLGLCALLASIAVADILLQFAGRGSTSFVGVWGNTLTASSRPYHLVVLSTDPGSASDLAGVRPGDSLDIRPNSAIERFWLFGQPLTGRGVTYYLERDGREWTVRIVSQTVPMSRVAILTPIWIGFICLALFAAVIAYRKSGDPEMRMLSLVLVTYGLWAATNEHYFSSESLWVLIAFTASHVAATTTVVAWAVAAGSFGRPQSRLRVAMQGLCVALVVLTVMLGFLRIFAIVTLSMDPVALSSALVSVPFALACVAATACTVLALAAAPAVERQRAAWSLVPAALLILAGFGADAIQGVVRSYDLAWGSFYVASAVTFVTPMVLTYVALNRRLLDIGFVVNRAAVFAIVSTTLIAVFVIVEWVLNEWLSANHTTSVIAGMLVALALGLSMRYVHRFADRFVDRVLFRKRYEDEASLRRFAHEAGFITNRATLLERALATVRVCTGADASIHLLGDGAAGIDEDYPALVSLRASRKPVDLKAVTGTALQGQFAFPMVARGELVAVLVCGDKGDSETYAPDEAEALRLLADGVGSSLGALGNGASHDGDLTSAVAELRAAIRDLREMKTSG